MTTWSFPQWAKRWTLVGILGCICLLSIYDLAWLFQQRYRVGGGPSILRGGIAPEVVVPKVEVASKTLGEFRLSAERGHPVLLDFWATWCGPCLQSLPILDGVYQRLAPRGLVAIAINSSEDERTVRAFATRIGMHLPIGLDEGAASDQYGVTTIPHLVLIGSDGKVKRVFRGVHSAAEIEGAVLSLGF